jgi:hypothetical protein
MCGIVGFITNATKVSEMDRSRFLKQALIIDTLRGDDSTGVFGVGHEPMFDDGSAYWFKQLGGGEAFTDTKEYWENFVDVSNYRCVVGHNRAATIGGVTADTAHPFQEGPITLVHNGTLTSTHGMPNPMAGLPDVEVDSHAICHNLALHSVDEVVSTLHGAFALVWHDARDDSVNIVRNSKRPLHFGMNKQGNTLYFMSEGEMLSLLDTRIRLGISSIYYPSEGQYLKWLSNTPLDRPITRELDLYEDTWYTTYNTNRYGGYGGAYNTGYGADGYSGYDWDEEDDDDPLGKQLAHNEKDDWIFVGGRKKEVPMLIQEGLLSHDVVVEDRWEFTPSQLGMNPQDTDRMYVHGEIHGLGKGVIYSISPGTANQTGTGSCWTVRIIGMKLDTNGEPWFICRLVSTFVNPKTISNHVVRTTQKDDEDTPVDAGVPFDDEIPFGKSAIAYDAVPGPGGILLNEHDFYREVADGCVMCTKPISIRDSYDLIWTGEGAICPNCDDRLYESIEK